MFEGRLGCPNCRDAFPVHRGVADLRPPPRAAVKAAEEFPAPLMEPVAVAALLGLDGAPGLGLVLGDGMVGVIGALAEMSEGMIWVAARRDGWGAEGSGSVSRTVVAEVLPFHDRSLRAAAADAGGSVLAGEFARVLRPGGRLLLSGLGPAADGERFGDPEEFTTLAKERGTLLLQRV